MQCLSSNIILRLLHKIFIHHDLTNTLLQKIFILHIWYTNIFYCKHVLLKGEKWFQADSEERLKAYSILCLCCFSRGLQQVQEAFDPFGSQSPGSRLLAGGNCLQLARTNQQLAEAIKYRLLPSHVTMSINSNMETDWHDYLTQAESHAKQVIVILNFKIYNNKIGWAKNSSLLNKMILCVNVHVPLFVQVHTYWLFKNKEFGVMLA